MLQRGRQRCGCCGKSKGRTLERNRFTAKSCKCVKQNRCRNLAADQAGDRTVVGAPDLDADGYAAIVANRPGVAIAIGCPGLVGDAFGESIHGRWCALQDIENIPCGNRVGDDLRSLIGCDCIHSALQNRHCSIPGQSRIQAGQIKERDTDPAKTDCEPWSTFLGQSNIDSRLAQTNDEPGSVHLIEQFDRWDIERELESFSRRDISLVTQVKVLGAIGAEPRRAVIENGFRMCNPVLKGKAVDEGLQTPESEWPWLCRAPLRRVDK